MNGRVHLVGAGPGDPGLLTARARQVLGQAEILVYDAPCEAAILALVPEAAERIAVGRWPDAPMMGQAEINRLLVERASEGRVVVRLKNGDPFVFGRGGEEALAAAAAGLDFEIVPGVTAALAAACLAGIPITQRGVASEAVLAIIQSDSPENWDVDLDRLAAGRATLLFYLGPEALGPLAAELERRGRSGKTPIAIVENVSLPRQRVTVCSLESVGPIAPRLRSPLVAIVGEVVRLRESLAWQEKRALHGHTIVLTRGRDQSSEMAESLRALGADVLLAPAIEIAPPPSWKPLDNAIEHLERFDWLVLTSANAVEALASRLLECRKDARALASLNIAVIGSATAAALRRIMLQPDLVPPEFNADSLSSEFSRIDMEGKRVLFVRALVGRDALPNELERLGATVEVLAGYQTVSPPLDAAAVLEADRENRLSAVVFASPSAAQNFVRHLGEENGLQLLRRTRIAAIGPATCRAIEELGLTVSIHPRESTGASLVEALAEKLGGGTAGAAPPRR